MTKRQDTIFLCLAVSSPTEFHASSAFTTSLMIKRRLIISVQINIQYGSGRKKERSERALNSRRCHAGLRIFVSSNDENPRPLATFDKKRKFRMLGGRT